MTIDKEQIRALAEQVIAEQKVSFGNAAMAAFHEAATPAIILALLDEIERLEADTRSMRGSLKAYAENMKKQVRAAGKVGRERDQIKAENEALRSQVSKLQSEPNSYQSGFDAGRAAEKAHADNWRAEAEGVKAESEALRKIISESAKACGAAVSVECSLEFMAMLPSEIASVIRGLCKDAARLTWLDESQEVDSVGPTLCCGKHRATLREAIDAAMAMEACHG